MKILKISILISLLAVGLHASACGPFYWNPAKYNLYRLQPYNYELPYAVNFVHQNCLQWCNETGFSVSDSIEVRRAIYEGTEDNWKWAYAKATKGNRAGRTNTWFEQNLFVRHIIKGYSDAAYLLYSSKKYENIRDRQRSPWNYEGRGAASDFSILESISKDPKVSNPNILDSKQRFADRYLFLRMKVLWALGQQSNPNSGKTASYSEQCVALWQKYESLLKGSILHDHAEDYVARALTQLGRTSEAEAMYIQCGRIKALVPDGTLLPDALNTMLRIDPSSPYIAYWLQQSIFTLENDSNYLDNATLRGYCMYDNVLSIAKGVISNSKAKQRDVWRYAAACILDHKGRPAEALKILNSVGDCDGDQFLANSVRVLKFWLRVKTDAVNDSYERYALGELRWIDEQLQKEMQGKSEYEKKMIRNSWYIPDVRHVCFFHDVMNHIVLADSVGLAWRLAASGREVRALQVANMADNGLVHLGNIEPVLYGRGILNSTGEFGAYDRYNPHDYCNQMFMLADQLPAAKLEAYLQRMLHPEDDTDRWLNSKGYTDNDYWRDIVATHYIRECNYAAAVTQLQNVSTAYQQRMNCNFAIDPFAIDNSFPSNDKTQYKLHFAQRMVDLMFTMNHDDNMDKRGLAMLEYTIGMENSFGRCWYLTSYALTQVPNPKWGQPYVYFAQSDWTFYSSPVERLTITTSPYATASQLMVKNMRKKAFETLASDDAKARYYARLCDFNAMMENYSKTPTAQYYALVCDEWKDYRVKQ